MWFLTHECVLVVFVVGVVVGKPDRKIRVHPAKNIKNDARNHTHTHAHTPTGEREKREREKERERERERERGEKNLYRAIFLQ